MKKTFIPSSLLTLITSFLITSSLLAQVPAYVPTNGLVGYWPFNGNANDESGNGNNGTVNGATLTTDRNGNANSSYYFNGINNYIQVPFSNTLNSIQNGITMSAWVLMQGGTGASTPPRVIELRGAYGNGGDAGFVMLAQDNSNISRTFEVRWHNDFGNNNISISPTNSINSLSWQHILFTADGSTATGKFYLNGILINNNSSMPYQGIINSCNYNNNPLIIGAETNLLGMWGGKIDDIAIYNRALTQEEITSLYNGTTTIPGCTNTSACNYNASASQDDGSCTFPAQTYLNCAGSCLNDANNNGICDEVEATFPSYLPANGLVAWYPFNGNANDESGHGNNGTVNGATLTADRNGNANSAYLFSGVPDRIDIGTSLNPSFSMGAPQSSWTVAAWVNKNSNNEVLAFSDYNSVLGNTNPGENDITLSSHLQVNGNMAYVSMRSNAQEFGANGGNFLSNEWRHIAFSASNNSIKLFSDGQLISEVNYDSNLNYFESPFYRIGSSMWNGNYGPSTGIIDDIAIYNRALTPTEISALYTGTNSNGGNGNNTSSATSTVPAGISYQAVARNAQGTALANTAIQVKFSLIADSLSGTTEYVETHSLSTNTLGLFATAFGTGSAVTGTWVGINWTHANKYLKVELDAGNGFVELGTQQLLSSPFAIRAQSAATLENGALPVYLDNAAAIAGGLTVGKLYRTATGDLKVVY